MTHYIHLTKVPSKLEPLVTHPNLPNDEDLQKTLELLEEVDTLCGDKSPRMMCFYLEQFKFYYDQGLGVGMCPDCLEHPDVGLFLLSEL